MNLWLLPPYLHISSWCVPTQGDIDDDRAADQSRDYDPLWGEVDDDNVVDDDDDYQSCLPLPHHRLLHSSHEERTEGEKNDKTAVFLFHNYEIDNEISCCIML